MQRAQAAAIRAAIIHVMHGDQGLRRVPCGLFLHGVFAGMRPDLQQTLVKNQSKGLHHFDVELGPSAQHPASSCSALGSRSIEWWDVNIPVWTHKRSTLAPADRESVFNYIAADFNEAIHALHTPESMTTTLAGKPTGIASGIMGSPGEDMDMPVVGRPQESFDDALILTVISGRLIVTVDTSIAA